MFVSDSDTADLPAVSVAQAVLTDAQNDVMADGFSGLGNQASIVKFELGFDVAVSQAAKVREAGGNVEWYYMAGDDTFVDVPRMGEMVRHLDASEAVFMAQCCTNGVNVCEYNVSENGDDVEFYSTCGGGGWLGLLRGW